MKELRVCLLAFTVCLAAACDQDCPQTGSPNTTYVYSYFDSSGTAHIGSFTTDDGGNATITDVPDDIDCSKITSREDKDVAVVQSQV
ncbi:MAG TPA: hypothetical protein VF736_03095 [Pyrinomonadaceae bacterium]|jgi:hypothetical protein